jgi:hypothetical protein
LWFVGAFIVVLGATLVPFIGAEVLAPVGSLIVGAVAAWWLLRTPGQTIVQAITVAAIAGIGALLASIVAFVALGAVLGNIPAVQEFVRSTEPNPQARLPYEWIPGLSAALGGMVGFGLGLINLLLAVVGGMVTAVVASPERRSVTDAIG